MNLRGIY